jgi:hypothetical protein
MCLAFNRASVENGSLNHITFACAASSRIKPCSSSLCTISAGGGAGKATGGAASAGGRSLRQALGRAGGSPSRHLEVHRAQLLCGSLSVHAARQGRPASSCNQPLRSAALPFAPPPSPVMAQAIGYLMWCLTQVYRQLKECLELTPRHMSPLLLTLFIKS